MWNKLLNGLGRLWGKVTSWKNVVYVFTVLVSGSVVLRALDAVADKWIVLGWLAAVVLLALAFYTTNIVQHLFPLAEKWLERKR